MSILCSFFLTLYPTLHSQGSGYHSYLHPGEESHLFSAPSKEEWGLENSVDMYSVLRNQDTFLACCLALHKGGGGRGRVKNEGQKKTFWTQVVAALPPRAKLHLSGAVRLHRNKTQQHFPQIVTHTQSHTHNHIHRHTHTWTHTTETCRIIILVCIWQYEVNGYTEVHLTQELVIVVPLETCWIVLNVSAV